MKVTAGGRLVLNHSSIMPKLKSILEKLCNTTESISTVVPGRIARTNAKSDAFTVRITTALEPSKGFKLIARHESIAQEVFIVTKLSKADLVGELNTIASKLKFHVQSKDE
jgi:hypothetical protein